MHKQFMFKWAGSFNLAILLLIFCQTTFAQTQTQTQAQTQAQSLAQRQILFPKKVVTPELEWTHYEKLSLYALQADRTNGISYIISGGIALAGGIAGANITSDPIEKGVYALFQTIGVASIGFGAYKWKVGDESRLLMNSLKGSTGLTERQKLEFLKIYYLEKKKTEEDEKLIKAVTHGLIAALNFYNASQQKQDGVKNTLYFVGGANMLAAISYSF